MSPIFVFLRDVWIRTQNAAIASSRASNLATHLPYEVYDDHVTYLCSSDDNVTVDDEIDDNTDIYLCFSDERLLPNDADVDADWPG